MRTFIRRIGLPLVKLAILGLVIWGCHRTVMAGLDGLEQNGWPAEQLQPWWALLAGVLYLLSQLPSGWFWQGVLIALGQAVSLAQALRAYYIGHLGKHFPGKALVIALRAALVAGPCNISAAVVAVFYETLTTMAVGAVLAAVILLTVHREQTYLILGSLGLALVLGAPTLPAVFLRCMRMIRLPEPTATAPATVHFGWRFSVCGWLTIAAGWFFAGASLWATVRAIGVEPTSLLADLPLYTATVALAVAAGFVSLLPAGIGVRDIILLQLLAPQLDHMVPSQGNRLALVAVIVLRLIWLASEVVLAAILYPLGTVLQRPVRE